MKQLIQFSLFTLIFLLIHVLGIAREKGIHSQDTSRLTKLLDESGYNATRNPAKAIEYAREALRETEENDIFRLKAYYLLGFGHYNKNNYDSALTFLQKSLETNQKVNDEKWQALIYNRLGNTFQLKGSYDKALKHYQKALKINRNVDDRKETARSLTNIGSIYRTFGNYDKAIQFHLEALAIYEKIEDTEGIAWTSLNIARLFKLNASYDKALDYLNKSYDLYKIIARDKNVKTGETLCLKEYGLIYAQAGNLEKALEYSTTVLKRNKKNDNRYGIANSLFNIGKIYYKKGAYDTSLQHLKESLELKNQLQDKLELPSLLRLIGDNYYKKGNTRRALSFYEESLKEAEKQNLKSELKESYNALYKLYRKTGDYNKALEYHAQYSKLKDSLANQHINELEMQYEFEKEQEKLKYEQRRQQAIQEARLKRQKIITWAFVGGFVLLLLLVVVIYRSYRRKIETNRQLALQKEEIETQRDEIEAQRDMATKQRDQIAKQNKIITESIEYARRIQTAVLPQENTMNDLFYDYLVFYKPKNIVSGDFYWISQVNSKTIIAAADCTGHGVPGAFMSMLGVAFLNEIINQSKVLNPDEILNQLRRNVIDALHQTVKKRGSRDGMDIALAVIDPDENMLYYAGAYNPVYIIRDGEINEIKADRMPIGVHAVYQDTTFTVKTFRLQSQDKLYFFSDGFYDQFGGENGHKFGRQSFKNMLLEIHDKSMEDQNHLLEERLTQWKGNWPQIDDIMILGFHYNHK